LVQQGSDTEGTAPRIGADGSDVMRGDAVEGRDQLDVLIHKPAAEDEPVEPVRPGDFGE
jgi:hypothetical protein